MTIDGAQRANGRHWSAGLAPAHLIVIATGGDDSLRAGRHAGALAAELRCPVTVALVLERPWTLALSPYALGHLFDDDAEIGGVARSLTEVLDPYAVPWRLEPVTVEPVRTIGRLVDRRPGAWLLVTRRRWLPGRQRAARIASVLGRRCALPVLTVPR